MTVEHLHRLYRDLAKGGHLMILLACAIALFVSVLLLGQALFARVLQHWKDRAIALLTR